MKLRAWLLSLAFVATLAPRAHAQQVPAGEPEPQTEQADGAAEEAEEPQAEPAQDTDATGAEQTAEEQPAEVAAATEEPAASQAAPSEPEQDDGTLTIRYAGDPDPDNTTRLVIPPVLYERAGDTTTAAVFPLYFQRSAPDDFQLVAGPYYHRRGAQGDADVVFPFVWSYRFVDGSTTVVPPFYYRTRPEGFDLGLAPLFFTGRKNDSTYTVIPPLLTVAWANNDHAYTFSSLFWRIRHHEDVDWGVFPFLWNRSSPGRGYNIVAPFYFRFEEGEDRELTVIPPLLFHHRSTPDGASWGITPLLYHSHDAHSTSTTFAPLFHYDSEDNGSFRFFTLLGGYARTPDSHTLVTPLYQRHRGKTELDAAFPLFMSLRDPRDHSSLTMVTPLFWRAQDPASSTTVAFPFFAQISETGRYDTFLSLLYWDMQRYESNSRTSIAFPIYWRFRSGQNVSQLALNTYYQSRVRDGVRSWEFHFFPLFAFGDEGNDRMWWTVLYGLAEHRDHGETGRGKVFWIPFDTH